MQCPACTQLMLPTKKKTPEGLQWTWICVNRKCSVEGLFVAQRIADVNPESRDITKRRKLRVKSPATPAKKTKPTPRRKVAKAQKKTKKTGGKRGKRT